MQIGFYDGSKEFVIDKPIRLIELFGGIGCQASALERLKVNFEHYRMCDFDKYAVQSYNAIHGTNFKPSDITKLKAEDLGITETDKYDYIMTYSFPCTDLSKAGQQKGMAKGSGTRSGLLWEVERLLDESKELPQVLLMENVPDVIGTKNIMYFAEWIKKLESLGYKNYWKVLNATEFGIPQNRERCFMVSLLGDYYYNFPQPTKLELRLKDMLEEIVDEKYYLSDKLLKNLNIKENYIEKGTGKHQSNQVFSSDKKISRTLAASDYKCPILIQVAQLDGFESSGRIYGTDGLAPTINTMGGGNREPKIAVNIKNINDENEEFSTLGTNCGSSTSAGGGVVKTNHRIRKLTPKECWRLMGLTDEQFDKAKASGVSNSQLYKQAGNGIVVNVLMSIFQNLIKEEV